MATTPNYAFEKRQKELAKKAKKAEKLKSKSAQKDDTHVFNAADGAPNDQPSTPALPGQTG